MDAYTEHLGSIPLFRDCSAKELKLLAREADEVEVAAGRVLAQEGTTGREVFVIVSGQATVSRGGEGVASLGPGDYFGELALLDDGPRNASVTAATDMVVLVLGRREFISVLDAMPGLARKLLFSTAARLRESAAHLD